MKKYQIDKNMFKKNNNIVFSHFKMNWKIILFFIIFWIFVTMLCLIFTVINPKILVVDGVFYYSKNLKLPMISRADLYLNDYRYKPDPSHPGTWGEGEGQVNSISTFLTTCLFAAPEMIFFGIVSMFFINKIFVNEINNGKVSFWTTLPLSRNQIFLWKYLFIIFTLFCIFMPSYLLIITFSSIASDASKYIGDVILYGFETFLFNVFLLTLFLTLSFLLLKKSIIANIINSFILVFIFISFFLDLLYKQVTPGFIYEYIHYISIESLVINTLNFSWMDTNTHVILENHGDNIITMDIYKYLSFNKILIPIFSSIMIFGSIFWIYLNLKIFKKMNLNI